MNTILSGRHYMMVVNKINKEYFTCNILSHNGSVKAKICIYPDGRADLYKFNDVNYRLYGIDVFVFYGFVKDKILQKKVEEYLNKCYKNWQEANNAYLYLEEKSIVNPKPDVDYEELIDKVDYNLFLKYFCYINIKKYKKLAEKATYLRLYDNIITTKDMLMRTECDAFIPMIHLCDKKLLVVKEKLASLENK